MTFALHCSQETFFLSLCRCPIFTPSPKCSFKECVQFAINWRYKFLRCISLRLSSLAKNYHGSQRHVCYQSDLGGYDGKKVPYVDKTKCLPLTLFHLARSFSPVLLCVFVFELRLSLFLFVFFLFFMRLEVTGLLPWGRDPPRSGALALLL